MKGRRRFVKDVLTGFTALGVGSLWSSVVIGCSHEQRPILGAPDENGVRLPEGLSCRIIARSSQVLVSGSTYKWHAAPDGGACFGRADGGWIYVSNSEMDADGGAGAVVFDVQGEIIDAYPILEGTRRNCAGGATPWGTWLSCEEVSDGRVWECDPEGNEAAVVWPALGVFNHEAVAVDPVNRHLYMTEDEEDGCLYRFIPDSVTGDSYDLSQGVLQTARLDDQGRLEWVEIADPAASVTPTRYQLADAARFDGGEGVAWFDGYIYFTTKGDNRVWRLHIADGVLEPIYDALDYITPILTGVDNIAVSHDGEILVAEDGGDMQIVALDAADNPYPLMQLVGQDQSEITGPAFSPDGKRLYFSSQRGVQGRSEAGITYEISGF